MGNLSSRDSSIADSLLEGLYSEILYQIHWLDISKDALGFCFSLLRSLNLSGVIQSSCYVHLASSTNRRVYDIDQVSVLNGPKLPNGHRWNRSASSGQIKLERKGAPNTQELISLYGGLLFGMIFKIVLRLFFKLFSRPTSSSVYEFKALAPKF